MHWTHCSAWATCHIQYTPIILPAWEEQKPCTPPPVIFLFSCGADAHLYTNLSVILLRVKDCRLDRCLCCLWCVRLPSTNVFFSPCHQVSCLPAALLLQNKSELAANTWSADVASCKEKTSLLVAITCTTCFWLPFAVLMHYLLSLCLNWRCLFRAMHTHLMRAFFFMVGVC